MWYLLFLIPPHPWRLQAPPFLPSSSPRLPYSPRACDLFQGRFVGKHFRETSVSGYATLRLHILETPCGRLVFACLSSASVINLDSGQWVTLLEEKLERACSPPACFFFWIWESLVTSRVLRAACAAVAGEGCLLSAYCMPDTYIISFNLCLISKTGLWTVETMSSPV